MESVLERINKNNFWKFAGGIHPPQQKFLTNNKPIKSLRLPKELIIPLKQHIGKAGDVLVKIGDNVLKGQTLTSSENPMTVPVHAPTSGVITAIKPATIAHPSGMSELCLFMTPDGLDTWRQRDIIENLNSLTKSQIISKIADAGIAGMGGAGFPTSIKVSSKSAVDFLIINAAECEPYITADDLLIREHSSAIINGVDILNRLLAPGIILIGIEDNKPEAIAALKAATKNIDNIKVCVLPTEYPTGGEKQLIKALTGQEVPSGVLPVNLGIVMQNIATVFAISEAIINDIPLIRRVVTVTGQALEKPQNVWALLGTPIQHLVEQCSFHETDHQRVIMGGPLMGFALPTLQVPVVKTTNCILVPTNAEISPATKELECIRCGQCAEVCPSSLLPQELQWYAKSKDYQKLEDLNLFDCIECGACAYVCPSQIPLVQYYRVGKAEIRFNKVQEFKADKAKQRFEARKVRLEKEKLAREAKHQKAIDARKAAASTSTGQANNSAVAAALARVKAKKAQQAGNTNDTADITDDVKSRAAEAIARAKAKKAAQTTGDSTAPASKQINDDVKSRAADAIARIKAKKLAEADKASTVDAKGTDANLDTVVDTVVNKSADLDAQALKKAKTAATIAKAKAKKLAKAEADKASKADAKNTDASVDTNADTSADTVVDKSADVDAQALKKAKTAATIAKAKAKKLAKAEADKASKADAQNTDASVDTNADTSADTSADKSADVDAQALKKAKTAATIAKAKAKKLAKAEADQASKADAKDTDTSVDTVADTSADKSADVDAQALKKAKTAATVAKAKAKKLAKAEADKASTADVKDTDDNNSVMTASDIKKQKIAAAIAKAKANKASAKQTPEMSDEAKKEKIAQAIKKAKAQKLKTAVVKPTKNSESE
ncbi:electron transport complex subunit RsxC [Colwelliaceae bacterium BS250]